MLWIHGPFRNRLFAPVMWWDIYPRRLESTAPSQEAPGPDFDTQTFQRKGLSRLWSWASLGSLSLYEDIVFYLQFWSHKRVILIASWFYLSHQRILSTYSVSDILRQKLRTEVNKMVALMSQNLQNNSSFPCASHRPSSVLALNL